MPIKRCSLKGGGKGYKYGDSGHCYAKKSDCIKQMRAMYSNGYKGHSKNEEITISEMVSLLISDVDENDPLFYEICKDLNLGISDIYIILESKKEDKLKKKTKYPDPSEDDSDEDDEENEDINDDDEEEE